MIISWYRGGERLGRGCGRLRGALTPAAGAAALLSPAP